MMDLEIILGYIETLAENSTKAAKSEDALRLSQASLNLTHVLRRLEEDATGD